MNDLIERDNLLRRMSYLQEQNKKLEEKSIALNLDFFGDVKDLRSKVKDQEHHLKEKEGLFVSQIYPYKPIDKDPIEMTVKNHDKGKQKVIGIQINKTSYKNPTISKLDLGLEKENKEKEDLAKELEKV